MKTFFKEILRTLTYRSVFLLSLPMLMLAAPSCEKSDDDEDKWYGVPDRDTFRDALGL